MQWINVLIIKIYTFFSQSSLFICFQSDKCPEDEFQPATLECRGAKGICDIAEFCTGATATWYEKYILMMEIIIFFLKISFHLVLLIDLLHRV